MTFTSTRAAFFVLLFSGLSGAVALGANTYYSQGSGDATVLSNWNDIRAGGGSTPADFTSGDLFVVQNGHSMTTGAAWTLSGAGNTLQIENGGTLTATFIVSATAFHVDNGGRYVHNAPSALLNGDPSDLPGSGARIFGPSSTVEIQRWANGGTVPVPLPGGVSWGNLIINVATLGGPWSQKGLLTTVNGNLTIQATGGSTFLRLTDSTAFTMTIGGDFSMSGGNLNINNGSVAGLTITINLAGNFTQSGGNFQSVFDASSPTIIFTGGPSSVVLSQTGGIFLPAANAEINWQVAPGKTLTLDTTLAGLFVSSGRTFTVNGRLNFDPGANFIGGPGNFALSAGATLGIGSIFGIDSGTGFGNIRVSGARTYDPAANFEFMTSVATDSQMTGTGFPPTVNNLTYNNGSSTLGLFLSSSLVANGALSIPAGKISTGSNAITLGPAGVLNEIPGAPVVGTISTTRNVVATSGTESFGNIGPDITLNGTPLGNTTVTRKTGIASTGNGNSSILRYFDIAPTVNTGLNATMTFPYDATELNGQSAGTLELYKSTNNGATWADQFGSVNTTARTVTVSGVNEFSRWTASNTANPIGVTLTPTTSGISPATKISGAGTFSLTVNGTNFINGNSVVRFNDSSRTTVFVSATQLTATIPAGDLILAGTYPVTVFNSGGGGSSNAQSFIVDPGPVSHFLVEAAAGGAIPAQSAASPFNIRITARDSGNNIVTGFSGTAEISSTGTLVMGSGTTAPFLNGILPTHAVEFFHAGTFTITATRTGGPEQGTSNAFAVNPGALHHFLVERPGGGAIGTHTAGFPFQISIVAQDTFNSTVSGFTGTVVISSSGTLSSGSGTTAAFTGGVLSSHSVTVSTTGNITIQATRSSGTETGESNAFTVKNVGTYYSQGSLDAATLSSWNSNRGGGGAPAPDFSSGDIFVLQNGHAMTTSLPWTVSGDTNKIQIESGGTLTATSLVQTGAFQVDNGGLYVHRVVSATPNGSSSDMPGSRSRIFGPSSTVEIQHWANAGTEPVPLPPNVEWGNLTINILDSIAGPSNLHMGWNQQGGLRTIRGNFTLLHTGSPDGVTHKFLRLTDTTSTTLTIGGDLIIRGNPTEGLNLNCCDGNGISVAVFIGGSYIQSGGFFESSTGVPAAQINNNPSMVFTGGDSSSVHLTQSGGTLNSVDINWQVAAAKTVQFDAFSGLTISSGRALTVNGGLIFVAGSNHIDGEGDFVLGPGATLGIASIAGIDTGTGAGNIRLSGTRTFDPAANYEFVTSLANPSQESGAGFPHTVNNLTISNTVPSQGVVMNVPVTVNGALTVNPGTALDINGQTLAFAGSAVINNGRLLGSLAAAPSSTLIFLGAGAQSYAGTGTVGTPADPLAALEVNNSGSGLTINPAATNLNVNRINLVRGLVTNSNKLTLGNSGVATTLIQIGRPGATFTGGSFDVAPTFSLGAGGLGLLYLQESTPRTTGVEIPPSGNIGAITIENTNEVILGANLSVSGSAGGNSVEFNGSGGVLALNGRTLTLAGTLGAANAAGGFKGSGSSGLVLNGSGPSGVLKFVAGGDTLNTLTVNRTDSGSVALGSRLTVAGTLTLTNGIFSVGSNRLALNGPAIGGTPANLQGGPLSDLSFGGSAAGVIIPASIVNLNNLLVSNTSGVSCGGDMTIGDSLTVAGGSNLVTGAHFVALGPAAVLSEAAGSTVIGKVTATRMISATSGTETFGNIGSDITLNGTAPGSTSVTRTTGIASTGNGNASILRYFDIAPDSNAALHARLTYHYDSTELNSHGAGGLHLYSSTDNGVTWTNRGGIVNIAGKKITAGGFNGISRWTASDPANSIGVTPSPTLASITPAVKTVGDSAFTLTVNGTGFIDNLSAVQFDGLNRPTNFISDTQLTAAIPSSDLAAAGPHTIVVFNSGGGGASVGKTLTVQGSLANIRVFLQGPFSGSGMTTTLRTAGLIPFNQPYNSAPWSYSGTEHVASIPASVVDWVLIEMRTGTTAGSRVMRRAIFVRNDGMLVDTNGSSPILFSHLAPGNYYVVITHRNHLPVMSATPLAINEAASLYDFTTGANKYFGGEAKALGGGKFGMYAGDYSGDGFIDSDDFAGPDNEVFMSGYRRSDTNMDGFVDSDDFVAPDNNVFKGTQVP